ncbi:hypothetical protein, partial [Bacteroides caecimuris]
MHKWKLQILIPQELQLSRYNTGTQSSGCLIYLIYNALKELVFLHCNIEIFSKYYAHRVFRLTQ